MSAPSTSSTLDLKSSQSDTGRGNKFWNSSVVNMKFSVEAEWIQNLWAAYRKPNYGMGSMDGLLEEVVGNKIEITGPLIGSYLKQIGKEIKNKLSHSMATGLMNPITVFIPLSIYRQILTLVRGYAGDIQYNKDGSKHYVTLTLVDSASRFFCPARFEGESYLAYRHFKKVHAKPTAGKRVSGYNGKSVVVITSSTQFSMDYNTVKELLTIYFYVQRYTADDFVVDSSLQALMNQQNL